MRRRLLLIFQVILLTLIVASISGCFGLQQKSLTITVEGQGTVNPPSGQKFMRGTLVSLRPQPAPGWGFLAWGGPDGLLVRSNQLVMAKDMSIKAIFGRMEHNLDIRVKGKGNVNQTIVPVSKGISEAKGYTHGSKVHIEAVPDMFWRFDHWEGAVTGTINPQDIILDTDMSIAAVFVPLLPSQGGSPVATDANVDGVYTWSDITSITPPARLKVWLNRFGTDRTEYQIEYVGTVENAGYRMIVCKGLGDIEIGHGDSGSPLLTKDNLVVGAISQIFRDGDTVNFKSTSIDDMLTVGNQIGVGKSLAQTLTYLTFDRSNALSFTSRGLSVFRGLKPKVIPNNPTARGYMVPRKLLPGHTICLNYLSGPINIFTTGTVTYEKAPGQYVALGHPDARIGSRQIPISFGYVLNMSVAPGQETVKEAVPIGPYIGTLTRDEDYGVFIDCNRQPETTPLKLIVAVGDGDPGTEFEFKLAKDNGSQMEVDSLQAAFIMQLEAQLRYTRSGSALGLLSLQVEGQEEQVFSLEADDDYDVLYGENGLANQIQDCVQSVVARGLSFKKAVLDVTISPKN